MDKSADKDSHRRNLFLTIKKHNLYQQYSNELEDWKNKNKIYPNTKGWALGVVITVLCYLIFIPFDVSEQFKQIYSLILGVISGLIQHFRRRSYWKKEQEESVLIMEDILSSYQDKC